MKKDVKKFSHTNTKLGEFIGNIKKSFLNRNIKGRPIWQPFLKLI